MGKSAAIPNSPAEEGNMQMRTSSYLGRSRMGGHFDRHSLAFVTALVSVMALVFATALVYGDASHFGWPTNECNYRGAPDDSGARHGTGPGCGVYKSHNEDQNGVLRGTGRIDELLGGHGDDLIYGRGAGDVIWGDFWPSGQSARQLDRLYGGDGNDFIYVSHGTNRVFGGAGNDTIRAHYGRGGTIDCGPGKDKLHISHRSKQRYHSVKNCERIDNKPE
jgi:hemolysin type calcium-binding protein